MPTDEEILSAFGSTQKSPSDDDILAAFGTPVKKKGQTEENQEPSGSVSKTLLQKPEQPSEKNGTEQTGTASIGLTKGGQKSMSDAEVLAKKKADTLAKQQGKPTGSLVQDVEIKTPENITQIAPPKDIKKIEDKSFFNKLSDSAKQTFDVVKNAVQQGSSQGDVENAFENLGKNASEKDLQAFANAAKKAESIQAHPVVKKFEEAKGIGEAWDAFTENPMDVALHLMTKSTTSLLKTGVDEVNKNVVSGTAIGATGGSVVPGVGTTAGAIAGAGYGLTAGMVEAGFNAEYTSDIIESLKESGIDVTDADQLRNAFNDDKKMAEFKSHALKKAVPIAVFDAFSGGLAGKLFKQPAKTALRRVAQSAAEMGVQAPFDAVGELVSQKVAGDEANYQAALAEVLGGLPQNVTEVASGVITSPNEPSLIGRTHGGKPVYEQSIPEELQQKLATSEQSQSNKTVESAIIEIGGETFEGKNHAEAILKAQQAGKDISQVDRKGQGMFKLSDGSIINRDEAKAEFGADRAEMLIPQDEASNQANNDYEKIKRQARTIENIEYNIETTVDEIRNNPSVESAQKLAGLIAEKNELPKIQTDALNKAVNINSDLADSQNGISGSQNSGGANVINQAPSNAEKSGTPNAGGVPNGEERQNIALRDVESTAKALEGKNPEKLIHLFDVLGEVQDSESNKQQAIRVIDAEIDTLPDDIKYTKDKDRKEQLQQRIDYLSDPKNKEKEVESLFKELEKDSSEKLANSNKRVSEAYHKAKSNGKNTELVKAVESLLGEQNKITNEPTKENLPTSVLDQSGTENSKTESGAEQVRKTVLGEKFYDQTSDQVTKDALARYGLDRSVKNQKEALDSARKLVQDIGIEAAREAFISDRTIFGDNRVALWGVLVEDAQNEQISTKTEDEYFRATNKLAELVDLGSEYATSLGQGSSMFRAVYDMLGVEYGASEQIRKYKKEHDGIIPKSLEDKFTEIANKLSETEKKLQEVEKQLEQKTVEASIAAIKTEANKSESTKKRKEIAKKKAEDGLAEMFGALATFGGGKLSAVDANESFMHGAIQAIEAFMELQSINFEEAYKKVRDAAVSKKFDPKKLDDIKDSLREQVNVNTLEDDLTDTSRLKISRKLLRELAQQTTDVDEFTGLVREAIKDEYPNATDREIHDAISGYGKTISTSKADGAKELAKLKNLMRAVSQLEDIAKGQRPKKTGFQREPTDADVRAKFNEVREAMKTLPLDPETKEGLLKSAQNAYETRLKNRMADLRREIDNNQKQKKTPSQIQKNTELEDKLSELKAEHDLHFKEENEAEKADNKERASEKRLADKIAELESEIEEGKLKEKADNPKMTAWSPKIAEKQKKLSELKAEHDTVLAEAKKVARDKKRIESSKRNIHRRIAELTRRMAENDFVSKQPVPFPEDAVRRKLLAEKEDLIEDYEKAKEKWEHENRNLAQKAKDLALEAWNLARIVGSGVDLGLVFIQGANYTVANAIKKPSVLWNAIKTGGKTVADRYRQEKATSDMKGQDWYRDAKKAGLYMEDPNSRKEGEAKLSSNLVSKAWRTVNPFRFGAPESFVRAWDASNIAEMFDDFSGAYMNTIRTQKFIEQREKLLQDGKTMENDPKSYKDVAGTINMFSGKSKLNVGGLVDASGASGVLGVIFYSPKNWASVLKQTTPLGLGNFVMMTEKTHEGYKMSRAQKMAVSDFSAMIAGTLGIIALYALMYEDDDDKKTKVNYTDPTRPDFLKPTRKQKDGDIVIHDPWGGKLPQIILQARLYSGMYSTTSNPKKVKLGSGMYTPTHFDLAIRYGISKLHPTLGYIVKPFTLRTKEINGKDVLYDHFEGKAYSRLDATKKLYTPMIAEAQMEMYDHDPKAIDIFDSFLTLIGAANVQAAKGKK